MGHANGSFNTFALPPASKKGLVTAASSSHLIILCLCANAYQCFLQIMVSIQAEEKVPFLHA